MCGRYMLEPGEIVNDAFVAALQAAGALQGWLLEPRYNIAPQQQILTLHRHAGRS